MHVAVTGAKGTLGKAVVRHAGAAGHAVLEMDLPEHDITDAAALRSLFAASTPDLVIHCAAYTNVDGAEIAPEMAFQVNALGTRNLALACESVGAALIYISTNMVFFDESRHDRPFTELETPCPVGVYATTKWAGEQYVQHLMRRFYIVRISWLYGKEGDSFVHKIIRAADKYGKLSVVSDEIATPTYAEDLSAALLQLGGTGLYGWYHLPNEGECSRYNYAQEIMRLTGREDIEIVPTALSDYKRPAPTAHYSTLKNTVGALSGVKLRSWQEALQEFIAEQPELQHSDGH